ncbi:hypothetical protein CA51_30860 [Rosistilla oblonga]|uniref:DUF3500 domain-containing protein n=1 Tax=Rosistilla oblonga TaxID=2527990 RepID=UPI00118D44CD|nr:DUF3500 domain-containing protein [Rosistilla oblonga]QDV13199.1 hypothetical protein CA51_30860 [Rosistilla oblonga]
MHRTITRFVLPVGLLGLVILAAIAQPPGFDRGLSEAFRGIFPGAKPEPGLFPIESTGVSTKPVMEAADAFLGTLSEPQRARTTFPVDDIEWRKWANQHSYKRQGVSFEEMNEAQRKAAFDMLQAGLSAKGLKKTQDIMKLNETLAELSGKFDEYGQWLYYITIMGEPSQTEPWGWQLDGHHLVINYFVLGDQVVMSPVFMGSEPIRADSGKFKGTVVMQDEQDKGYTFMQSLDPQQRTEAVLSSQKGGTNNLAEAFHDNIDLDYAGIPGKKLNEEQRQLLLELIAEYVGNMADGHAKVKMSEVEKHLDRTCFAWIGETDPEGVFYYRVHSPVILIEFDHQRRIAPQRGRIPVREHIHTVVRTPNGNDYGKDLLRQHYEKHDHSYPHEPAKPTK